MEQKNLTLKSLDEKINNLAKKIDLLIKGQEQEQEKAEQEPPKRFRLHHNNFETFENLSKDNRKPNIETVEFTDYNRNVFIQLPTIYVCWGYDFITIDFEDTDDSSYIELKPQAISKYKNALINGKVRSIPNVPPNFNQMSYLRFKEFVKWAGGEMMNWKTVLYLQLMWLFIKETKETPSEPHKWDINRYTSYQDTGQGVDEFLGIEQLFSGYTLFSLEGLDDSVELKSLFIKLGMEPSKTGYADMHGVYMSLFKHVWDDGFDDAWDFSAARLCKHPLISIKENKE